MPDIPRDKRLTAASHRIDWSDFHFFHAIAETGSLSKAAVRLQTTQPTLSRRLDDFERRLGVTLTNRNTTGVTLTEAGVIVAREAAVIARSVGHVLDQVGMLDFAEGGDVRFHCPDGLATYFISPALAQLFRVHPEIRLHISERGFGDAPADLAITFQPEKSMSQSAISLGWFHHAAFASREYLEMYGEPQQTGDAFQHRMLNYMNYAAQTENWGPRQKPLHDALQYAMQTDCGPVLLNAVANDAGIASMPTFVAHVEPKVRMVEVGELARVQFWLVFEREQERMPRIGATIAWLESIFDPAKNPWFREQFIPPRDFPAELARLS